MDIFRNPDISAVKKLLSVSGLPQADLEPSLMEHFFVAGSAVNPVAVIGLELFPPHGLLRSLSVKPEFQGRGVGAKLLMIAERHAAQSGVDHLYLLTNTADEYFTRLGYAVSNRREVATSIAQTAEFSSLCPDSAVCLSKRLTLAS